MPAAGEPKTRASELFALRDPKNVAAWEAFVARYHALIKEFVRHCRPRPGDEEDLTQDVLVKLFLKLPEYRYDRSRRFRGWLYRLVENEVRDYWRRRRPDHQIIGGLPDPNALASIDQFIKEEEMIILQNAIDNVQPRVKESRWRAFCLTTYEGRRGEDVAAELGMTVGAVYVARHYVTKLIREEAERIREAEGRSSGPLPSGPSPGNYS